MDSGSSGGNRQVAGTGGSSSTSDGSAPRDTATSSGGSGTGAVGGAGAVAGTGGATGSTVWRPFNDSSPWNTPIAANATVDPNSAQLITDFSTIPDQDAFWINIQDYSVPVYYVDSTTTPMVTVMAGLGGTGFRTGAPKEGDTPGSGPAPIPSNAMPAVGTDAHLVVVDKTAGTEWGFFNAAKSGANWKVDLAATLDLKGTGVRPPDKNTPWWAGHGPRACGFGLINGLITMDEVRAGKIEHALVIAYPHIRSRYYTAPASTAQGTFADAMPNRGIMCGGRMQLDPTLDVTTLGLSATGLMIARALQKYGALVGDYSGAVSLYADESPEAQTYWKSVGLNNNTAGKIPLKRFRVLQLGMMYDDMN